MNVLGLRLDRNTIIVVALILTGIAAIISGIDLLTGDWMGPSIQPQL